MKRRPLATVCILTYGDYLDYFQRCLDSILAHTPREEIALRLGFNAAPSSLAYARERLGGTSEPVIRDLPEGIKLTTMTCPDLGSVALWNSPTNLYKEPMARLMFYTVPLDTEYVIWFDDDSYVSRNWWEELRELLDQRVDYAGQEWWVDYLPGQQEMIRKQAWYQGVPFALKKGRPGVLFATGGFVVIRSSCLQEANYPDTAFSWKGETLKQYGGDTLLGEIVRQFGWTRTHHCAHVHVNVDLQGNHPAPRRGGIGRQFGSEIDVAIR
jgi:hypothetical protein